MGYRLCILVFLFLIASALSRNAPKIHKRQAVEPEENPGYGEECSWVVMENQVLAWHNNFVLHTTNKTAEECKEFCVTGDYGFECISYEFVPMAKYDCVLSRDTRESAVLLYNRTALMEDVNGALYGEKACNEEELGRAGAAAVGGGICGDDWDEVGESCFIVVNDTKTFDESVTLCLQMGATLASIHNKEEEDYLAWQMDRTSARQVWIGLRNPSGQNIHWIDGTDDNYRSQLTTGGNGNGEVYNDNGGGSVEECVRIVYNYYGFQGWWDAKCSNQLCYTCRKARGEAES